LRIASATQRPATVRSCRRRLIAPRS
jgi:hypothetical protein